MKPHAEPGGFRDYRFEYVFGRITPQQQTRLAAFWLREAALADPWKAEQRAKQAAILVTHQGSDDLVGASTVGLIQLPEHPLYFTYRMFLREQDRVPHLMWAVVEATREHLRAYRIPGLQPAGVLHVNENPRLSSPRIRRYFLRHGYRCLGQNERGHDLWLTEFHPDEP